MLVSPTLDIHSVLANMTVNAISLPILIRKVNQKMLKPSHSSTVEQRKIY